MTDLDYAVYVAPPKVAVSDDHPPVLARRMGSPTASTLIYGAWDAVLVDPLMTKEESRTLAEWVVATRKNVLTIFVTTRMAIIASGRQQCSNASRTRESSPRRAS